MITEVVDSLVRLEVDVIVDLSYPRGICPDHIPVVSGTINNKFTIVVTVKLRPTYPSVSFQFRVLNTSRIVFLKAVRKRTICFGFFLLLLLFDHLVSLKRRALLIFHVLVRMTVVVVVIAIAIDCDNESLVAIVGDGSVQFFVKEDVV